MSFVVTISEFAQNLLYYLSVALAGTIIFLFLTLPQVDIVLSQAIPEPRYRYVCILLIFFTLLYLADRFIEGWRINNHYVYISAEDENSTHPPFPATLKT